MYSLPRVWKQWGQVVTMVLGATWFRVSTFSVASWKNRYSLPARLAESPVHFSFRPRTAQSTPLAFRISTMLLAIFWALGS